MSNIAIKGATTGTGTFTIESPATNTDRTLTLPDEAGTVLTSASDVPAGNLTGTLPVGANIQMDYGSFTNTGSNISTTTTTHNDTGFGVLTVTPKTTSAKIYLSWSTSAWVTSSSLAVEFFVYRSINGGSYTLISPNNTWGLAHVDNTNITATSIHWNDEPNTTDQVQYKLYFNVHTINGQTGYILRNQATATRSLICID